MANETSDKGNAAFKKAETRIQKALETREKALNLAFLGLTDLPESLGQLTQLQTLYLFNNRLTSVPEFLGQLTQLQELGLSNNQLTSVPESLRELTALEELYLHDNPALGLPAEVLGPTWHEVHSRKKAPTKPAEILDYYFRIRRAGGAGRR